MNIAGRASAEPDDSRENTINIASLDLNALVSLDALLREKSVTRAAERLGLSQPALSSALRRLRLHFHDELLTRVGNSYQLTPLGTFLLARTATAMESVERVFDAKLEFDPEACEREFTVLTSDYALSVVGAPLLAALAARAPRARIRFRLLALSYVQTVAEGLRTADVGIFPHGYSVDLPHLDVFQDRWVCVVDRANEGVGDTLTLEHLNSMRWVTAINDLTAYTPASKQLELQGAMMNVEVVSDSFLAVPSLVAGTSRVAVLQERIAQSFPAQHGLRVLDCPFDTLPLVEALWWHPLSTADPEHQLLRSVFSDVAKVLAA